MGRRGPHPDAITRTSDEARRARSPVERFAVRFPSARTPLTRLVFALPPSGFRDAVVGRVMARVFEAVSRGDWEINTIWMHPEEYVFEAADASRIAPGMEGTYSRPQGYLEAMGIVLDPFAWMRVEFLGWDQVERGSFVARIRFRGEGAGSGAPIQQEALALLVFRGGWLVRHKYWWDVKAAASELGLPLPPARR